MNRRDFLTQSTAFTVFTAAAGTKNQELRATEVPPRDPTGRLVGIQIGGHSLYDEGIDKCLDLIQSTCRANALFLYSHSYYAAHHRPPAVYADHGVPIRDERKREITRVWVQHTRAQFANSRLKMLAPGKSQEYGDRDPFAELAKRCPQRGLKLFARILEPGQKEMANRIAHHETILSVDFDGQLSEQPCRNHPEWQAFWLGMLTDVARSYPLAGYQWGAERVGPLSELLWKGRKPFCFCEHCRARARRHDINIDRAQKGFRELYEFISAMRRGEARPSEGVLTLVMRTLLKFPEILAWDYQWRLALEEQGMATYKALKKVRADIVVGRHLDHQNTSWDGIFAAQWGFAGMVPYTDFIKPILYHDILGPRLRWWHLERLKQGPLAEIPLPLALELHYALRGYDPRQQPKLEELEARGLSADYVGKETRRIVEAVAGGCQVIAGIGLDIPDNIPRPGKSEVHFPSSPDSVEQAVRQALAAGAAGILISREYDEMRIENLRAVGKAITSTS